MDAAVVMLLGLWALVGVAFADPLLKPRDSSKPFLTALSPFPSPANAHVRKGVERAGEQTFDEILRGSKNPAFIQWGVLFMAV